ncbi:MAG: DNA mismatch repair endonuclease MutL [Planctomycetota bacterium]|nr:DNA mismatch repair endonuclease MutL [Planctomycetota bacterium]
MSFIRQLPRLVVDQIAAGEVVERPASVVKELVENAIDAGASNIDVFLEEGGTRRIEVRDDGIGINRDELTLALSSHATSKLSDAADLQAIASLGFRGEALASIASVSRLELISWPRDAERAAKVEADFGKQSEVVDCAGARGTRIVVCDLFAELPARRKFLKRPATEASHAVAWIERLALVHPGIGFSIQHEGKSVFKVNSSDDLSARCSAVFGKQLSGNMLDIDLPSEHISLRARVGPPEAARRDARNVHLFLNGRWVRDPRLLRAVREGVKEFVPHSYYPTLFLALNLPPEGVDVNVHPQKTEVRFRDERMVFGRIVNGLRQALSAANWSTRAAGSVGDSTTATYPQPTAHGSAVVNETMPQGQFQQRPLATNDSATLAALDSTQGTQNFLSVKNTFLFREVEGGVEIIDQHALHERVNLEELRQEIRTGEIVMQPLLVPALVELSRSELQQLLDNAEQFRKLGVDVSEFGETTLAINGVPARLKRLKPESLVADLLEILQQTQAPTPDQIQEEMLFSMSCRSAVMAGDHLDEAGLRSLLKRGADLPQDRTCAHGRPVRVFLSYEDLEKAFYRR